MIKDNSINQCSVVLTRDCNLRCEFCYVKAKGYCKNEFVSFENLVKIVDFCCEAKSKYIFFTGGEPLLYPYLKEILKYIKSQDHQMITAVATNGILLENLNYCEELIDAGLDYLDISMKGCDSQEWVDNTGFDGYDIQKNAIENLSYLNFDFTCSLVITSKNIFSICDIVKTAIVNGAKQISFTFEIDNEERQESTELYLEKNNPFFLIEAFISQINYLNKITKEWWIEYSFPLCFYTEKQLKQLEGKLASPCQIHKKNSVTFDTDLNILPCDMYFNKKIGQLGKDFHNVEEYNQHKQKELYKCTIEKINQLPSGKCINCKYLPDCYGGCPVLWKHYSFKELETYKFKYSNDYED